MTSSSGLKKAALQLHLENAPDHPVGCMVSPRLESSDIDRSRQICSTERVQANRLRVAIKNLTGALRETEAALEELRADSDPLAAHIFVARRQYRNLRDTKGGKRSEIAAQVSTPSILIAARDS